MTLTVDRLVDALADPSAYPHPAEAVEVQHTHISVVFLAGDFAYKVKKPVDLGFLDFTTLERRRRFCRREVLLNRRLAAGVYLGVCPVVEESGRIRMGDASPPGEEPAPGEATDGGRTVEYAVKMKRLPDDATLRRRLRRGDLSSEDVERVARGVADFHERAASGPEISRFGRFEIVAGNARENFEQTAGHVGRTVSEEVHGRLRTLSDEALERLRPLVEDRADRDVPRDTHGDLHLDHVYLFPDRDPPGDLVVLDCIEFNERFRYGDPIADAAFLVMDLAFEGRRDLADRFAEAYVRASGDEEGRELLPFYTAYRAVVRAKVEGMAVEDAELPEDDRESALRRARAHWLLALGELESPGRRPCLVLLGGLPGTGKTTLAEGLAAEAGFRLISSDRTRKELAGLPPGADASARWEEGIYTPEWSDRTYAACRDAAARALFRGERVLVDASFRREDRRRSFLELGRSRGVPVLWLVCRAEEATARARVGGRRGGGSDAGPRVYRRAADSWEEPGEEVRRIERTVRTEGSRADTRERALEHLRAAGLHDAS